VFGDGKEQKIKKDYPHSLLSGKEKDHLKDIMFTSSGREPRSSSSVSLSMSKLTFQFSS
jgi:hypothetical protein